MLDFLKPKPRDTVIARKYFEDSDRKLIRVQLQLKEHGSVVLEGMFNMAGSGDEDGARADKLIAAIRYGKLQVRDET